MQITITSKELTSRCGTLIDELAYSAGEATSDDFGEYYDGYSPLDYTIKVYNYEEELLANTKTPERLAAICATLSNPMRFFSFPVPKEAKHAGAWLALNEPKHFETVLETYTEKCKDDAHSYYDSDFLTNHAPDFTKQLQKAEEDQQEQDYKEWLYGDHQNYAGVLSLIAKCYGASEPIDYDDKVGDEVVFTFEDEELYEKVTGEYSREDGAEMPSESDCKEWLVDEIRSAINSRHEKTKRANEATKAERERLAAYKAEQKEKEDKERRKKLEKLTS